MGPVGIILYELWSKSSYMISVDAVSKFKLAHTFPLDTTTTIPQMAVVAKLEEADARRIIR